MEFNSVDQARPGSTFARYNPKNRSQRDLASRLERLTDQIIAQKDHILAERYPFDDARIIIVWGSPGVGKTHLIEAVVNKVKEEARDLLGKVWLARSNFAHDNMTFAASYGGKPIVIIDDIYAQKHDLGDLHPRTDIVAMMNFIRETYEARRLVIVTSNFPFREGILPRIQQVDETGRIVSRARELLARSGEVHLEGRDYREVLARQKERDPFKL